MRAAFHKKKGDCRVDGFFTYPSVNNGFSRRLKLRVFHRFARTFHCLVGEKKIRQYRRHSRKTYAVKDQSDRIVGNIRRQRHVCGGRRRAAGFLDTLYVIMSRKVFYTILISVTVICAALTLAHVFYALYAYEHSSIIGYVSKELW